MLKLRRISVVERYILESKKDLDDLKDHLGSDLFNDYMKVRDRISDPEYKDFGKLKRKDIEDIKDYISNFQSNTDRRKSDKQDGAKKLYEDDNWVVYRITTYPAAKYYGSNTKWCISGRFPGHEGSGEKYFNDYVEDNDLDGGYYFYINKNNPSEKYCVLQTKNKEIHSIWDAQDTNKGTSLANFDVYLPKVKGVNLDSALDVKFAEACAYQGLSYPMYYIEAGADPNFIFEGKAPLHYLCGKNVSSRKNVDYKEIIKVIVDHGGDIEIREQEYNETPLLTACRVANTEAALELLKYGANPNVEDIYGRTPLYYACDIEDLDLIKGLVKSGADVNKETKEGTPLFITSGSKYPELSEYLIKNGADVNYRNSVRDETPLEHSYGYEKDDTFAVILDGGADPNLIGNNGNSIFHWACIDGVYETVKDLLDHGADPNKKNKDGKTPLELTDDTKIKDLLVHYGAKE